MRWLIIAASVVDLPEPVAPTISTSPRLSMIRSREDLRQAQHVQARHVGGDVAQHHGRVAALHEDVDAEAAQAGLGDGEVDLPLALEVLALLRRS